jgi:TRAP-type C4-dicarboxylate transport system permease small subunit
MDMLQESIEPSKHTFLNHVFSSTEEGKAEILNVIQYAFMAIIPIVILNKSIQRFIPEADTEKSTLEILAEIFIQLIIMFGGIILIHRIITYFPTYSGFKYEHLTLTNVILAFLVLVLSIQTKMGIKVNIIVDRLAELWNGTTDNRSNGDKRGMRVVSQGQGQGHNASQADFLDNSGIQNGVFPPIVSTKPSHGSHDTMIRGSGMSNEQDYGSYGGPMAANGVLGGSFGSSF